MGFCGLYTDHGVGGLGMRRLDAAVVFEELATVDPSTSAFISIHNMVTWFIASYGTDAVRAQWGEAMTSGAKLGSYCLTEPGSGSDAASLKSRAQRDGDSYVLNGSKAFISGAGATDVLVVMARTGEDGARGISAFAVPADAPASAMAARKKDGLEQPAHARCDLRKRAHSCREPAWQGRRRFQDGDEGAGWWTHQYRRVFVGRSARRAGCRAALHGRAPPVR